MSQYDISDEMLSCYLNGLDFDIDVKKDDLVDAVLAERFAMHRYEAAVTACDDGAMTRSWSDWIDACKRRTDITNELEAYCLAREEKRQERLRRCVFVRPDQYDWDDDDGWGPPFRQDGLCVHCGRGEAEHGGGE